MKQPSRATCRLFALVLVAVLALCIDSFALEDASAPDPQCGGYKDCDPPGVPTIGHDVGRDNGGRMDPVVIGAWVIVILVGIIVMLVKVGDERRRNELAQAMVCPHCQQKGCVTTRRVRIKRGVSGAKATGALLTGGLSLLATGLSRKQDATEASCANCAAVWHYE